jgi:pilus assembly protein CpaF
MSMFSESLRAFLRPVVEFLDDPSVSEILINGPDDVWIEQHGRLTRTGARFTEDGLLAAARNMAQFVGRPLNDEYPRLDARLPDGSRIHVLLAPMARCGTVVSIRKFHPGGLTVNDLIKYRSLTQEAARFLEVCVQNKRNLIVAGGTGSGKTTLLNVLSHFIAHDERIVTIEDSAELQLDQQHLVPLESRPPDRHGKHAVSMRDLLHSSLRLRPDRIVIGEVRGGECFDLLQAMNTGHGGMLSTVHANSALETLSRLESLALLADVGLPLRALRAQVASAIHLVVCTARMRDGSRRVTAISEVLALDDRGDYRAQDLFVFTQTRSQHSDRVQGYLAPTGLLPSFQPALVADGFDDMHDGFFAPERYGYPAPKHFVGEPITNALADLEPTSLADTDTAANELGTGTYPAPSSYADSGYAADDAYTEYEQDPRGQYTHYDDYQESAYTQEAYPQNASIASAREDYGERSAHEDTNPSMELKKKDKPRY